MKEHVCGVLCNSVTMITRSVNSLDTQWRKLTQYTPNFADDGINEELFKSTALPLATLARGTHSKARRQEHCHWQIRLAAVVVNAMNFVTNRSDLALATVVINDAPRQFFFGHVCTNERTEKMWAVYAPMRVFCCATHNINSAHHSPYWTLRGLG